MEKVVEILKSIRADVDYATCTNLIDGHLLPSLSILSLVAELEEEFDVTIPAVEILPKNFNSAAAIWALVQRLQDEE